MSQPATLEPPAQNHNPEYHPEGDPSCTFWIQATPGTSYWRCLVPAKGLGGHALSIDPKRDWKDLGGGKHEFLTQKGPAVWQFPGNRTRGLIMNEMRQQGIPVFVEVDDNYLVPNQTAPGAVNNWKVRIKGEPELASREMHREIVRNACDGVIVSTEHLAKFYQKHHENVHVCPNSVDPDDWQDIWKPDDGVFRIGYAFSSSHHYDWEFILEALEYAAAQPNVEVVLIGGVPNFSQLNRFKWVNIPWADSLEDYRKNLGILDCGFAPIKSGAWADSRSDIKAMEYAMAGAMTVCSPTVSYELWQDDEGLPRVCLMPLENTAKAWTKIVKWLLKNREVAKEIAAEAKAYVLDQRTITVGAEKWREAFSSVGALV